MTNPPPSDFAQTFRALVVPQLKLRAYLEALAFTTGQQSFGDAVDAVWSYAAQRGAHYLDADRITELHDWVMSQVLAQADQCDAIAKRLTTERNRDPATYYQRLTAKHPGAHGVALAISPAYRKACRG